MVNIGPRRLAGAGDIAARGTSTRRQRLRSLAKWLVAVSCTLVVETPPATALDAERSLTEYALTNWAEDVGPFPLGVLAIAQDRDGYLWLGARTGLIRFDGNGFKLWKKGALPDGRVSVIRATRDGSLWLGFGTIGGVARVHVEDGTVTIFGTRDGLPAGGINELLEDEDGTIWAGAYTGLSRFREGQWTRVGPELGLPSESVMSLLRDTRGTLWVGTSVGVYRRGSGEEVFQLFASVSAAALAEDGDGAVWATDPVKGFRVLEGPPQAKNLVSSDLHEWPGRAMLKDRTGSLWVGTRGAGVIRIRGRHLDHLTSRDGLGSDDIRDLFEDRSGTIWIATRRGLSRLSDRSVRMIHSGEGDDSFVYAVTATRDGSVWTATAAGLKRRFQGNERTFGTQDGLPSRVVTALHEDSSGTLWVATTQGVARSVGSRFVPLSSDDGSRLRLVRSIATDRQGGAWLCDQSQGMFFWRDGKIFRLNKELENRKSYFVFVDSTDRVWIGFWDVGVAVYSGGRIDFYSTAEGLPEGGVGVIYEDRHGGVWVGTERGIGLFQKGRFRTFANQGLPNTNYVSIVEDKQGYMWFGSGEGLLKINPDEFESAALSSTHRLRYEVYGPDDGLLGNAGRPGMPSSARDNEGALWFVTSTGLALVNPDQLRGAPAPGPLRIEGIVADGQTLDLASPLALAPRTSRIQIDYSLLSLEAASKARFRYKLDGFDGDWHDAEERRQATYTNLGPGPYQFRVVSNSGGHWNETGAVLDFSIRPVFYQTRWFYGALVMTGALTIWTVWRLRDRHMRHEFNVILAERARVGREIHDTLLQSLVAVTLEFDDIAEQLDSRSDALLKQVSRIRERVEHHIREARQSIWNLRSQTLETKDLAAALRQAGELATAHHDIDFEFAVIGRPCRLDSELEEQLLRIAQEALRNAVRHGSPGKIRLELAYETAFIHLSVSDNGEGFNMDRLALSEDGHWGLISMRERAQQIGARFNVTSKPGGGTIVDTWAPFVSRGIRV